MTPRPAPRAIDAPGAAGAAPGAAVLRDLAVHAEPRTLARPGRVAADPRTGEGGALASPPRAPGATEDAAAGGAVAPRPDAVEVAYRAGHRAGREEAEAGARAERDGAQQAGYEAGFARGRAEGREQGRAEGREEGLRAVERDAQVGRDAIAERLATLERLTAAVPLELRRFLGAAEEEVVALCHDVVCRILGERLVTREAVVECVRRAVADATAGAAHAGGVTIHLHPRDLDAVRAEPPVPAHAGGDAARLVADERVGAGGCLVVTAEGTLDARLETQLGALRRLLTAAPRAGDGAPQSATASEDRA